MPSDTDPALIDTLSFGSAQDFTAPVPAPVPSLIPITLDQMILLFEPIGQGVLVFDEQGRLVKQSTQVQKLGLIASSSEASTAFSIFGKTVSLIPDGRIWQTILEGETIRINHSLDVCPNGYTLNVEATFRRLQTASDTYVLAHLHDITPVQLLEDELVELREELQLIRGLTGVGISLWDLQDQTISLCDRYEAMFGLNPDTFDGTYEAYFNIIHPDDETRVIQGMLQEETLTYRIIDARGQTRQIISRLRLIREADRVTGILKASIDVTDLLHDLAPGSR